MALVFKSIIVITTVIVLWSAYKVSNILTPPPLPKLDENAYWGPGKAKADDPAIKAFKVNIPDKVIEDLNRRLDNTRELTKPLEGIDFQYGFNSDTLQKIIAFWRKEYKWRDREVFLNQYPQFKTQIQGLDLHFIHVKPKITGSIKRTIPLLMMHGWPGSVREFYSLIPLLTTKPLHGADFAFEVIVPSLPGFGFSQAAARPGLGAAQIAIVFKNLMKRLGHEKFYVQGGDWGALIASSMATLLPNHVLGVHSNMCGSNSPKSVLKLLISSVFPSLILEPEHVGKIYPLSKLGNFIFEESGYMHIQSTKPDTVGVALSDSPAGLAAYIIEKFSTWTNPEWKAIKDGGLTKKYTYTDLLDNIMIYWVSGSVTSSMRIYAEAFSKNHMALQLDNIPTEVPTACALFKNELAFSTESMIRDKFSNLVQYNYFDDGGHFAAFELPQVMAKDIWTAIVKMETKPKETKKEN
ncbi:Juvenile hormone epoxide hydrolase 2 [Carabus blaptoides fortunei]